MALQQFYDRPNRRDYWEQNWSLNNLNPGDCQER